MPVVPPTALPAFLRRLAASLPSSAPPPTSALVPLLAATTLGHGHAWLAPCVSHALSAHPPLARGAAPPREPADPADDAVAHPRRLVVAQLKEALVKSAVLIGVPRAIETLLELEGALDDARDASRAFVRRGLDADDGEDGTTGARGTVRERAESGRAGLRSVYRNELDAIFATMRARGLEDLRYLSETTTYGTFLTPHAAARPPSSSPPSPSPSPSPSSRDPLSSDRRLLSVVTLACLIPQRTAREIHWHLRGAVRLGWARDEVEQLQRAVEDVCRACGVDRVGEGMPRVADVEAQQGEEERAAAGR
ncbi:hypothetical protein JCM3770_003799 [Rhodotorula araucariae]